MFKNLKQKKVKLSITGPGSSSSRGRLGAATLFNNHDNESSSESSSESDQPPLLNSDVLNVSDEGDLFDFGGKDDATKKLSDEQPKFIHNMIAESSSRRQELRETKESHEIEKVGALLASNPNIPCFVTPEYYLYLKKQTSIKLSDPDPKNILPPQSTSHPNQKSNDTSKPDIKLAKGKNQEPREDADEKILRLQLEYFKRHPEINVSKIK